jgi:hypothetical protein
MTASALFAPVNDSERSVWGHAGGWLLGPPVKQLRLSAVEAKEAPMDESTQKVFKALRDAQEVLSAHIQPASDEGLIYGPSEKETLGRLFGILDDEKLVEAQRRVDPFVRVPEETNLDQNP